MEIRRFGQSAAEEILTYPLASVRLKNGAADAYLHADQLGSVRTVTDAAGGLAKRSTYRPFGENRDWNVDLGRCLHDHQIVQQNGCIADAFEDQHVATAKVEHHRRACVHKAPPLEREGTQTK